ncbi:HNH endonuclease signature motif containing protein [Actinoallomurus iriomotensis]|uniref:HNH endonuclease signature motif containing protein n=1 Tax=Actinoallomurus iriomotensis TaxID=478107 RepID=UPI002553575E|nr:HNH endonuclease signature motif containing protein [Actinoallomurus iriomotensis]
MTEKSAKRIALSQPAKDWLWSESGGHCQNPDCRADLYGFAEQKHIGELAHIIPASMGGPRSAEEPELTGRERARPENVVVLCPTCHTVIDKVPEEYPADVLRGWKRRSQKARALAHGTPMFSSRLEARKFVEELLGANRAVFDLYGPLDDVFDDTRAEQWRRHVENTIIPNNQTLLRVLQVNRELLSRSEKATAQIFAVHAQELEERHLEGNWTPGSTRFPNAMESILEDKG